MSLITASAVTQMKENASSGLPEDEKQNTETVGFLVSVAEQMGINLREKVHKFYGNVKQYLHV